MSDEEKPPLTPANENPWYCLATVYGEQKEAESERDDDLPLSLFDENLASKNREAWNRWIASALLDEQRAELLKKGFDASELAPLTAEERTEFLKAFAKRTTAVPPDPQEGILFTSVRFERPISFCGFVFLDAFFYRAAFKDSAHFDKAVFFGPASFYRATFASYAAFSSATFSGEADFGEAMFSGEAFFSKVAFSGDTKFYGATFSRDAHFNRAAFSSDVEFHKATFSHQAYFPETVFSGSNGFTACEFKSHTFFAGTKFLSDVPDFRDAKLREATEWHDAQWPAWPKDKLGAQYQVYAFERLKAEMERLKKHEDEQFFFAKELCARRALLWFKCLDGEEDISDRAKFAFGWILNAAYSTFSGYGLSIGRPLVSLFVLFVLGAGVFAITASLDSGPMNLRQAAEFSFTNLFPFLPNKAGTDITGHLAIWTKYFGDLQSFLGVLLLFLLGLALRNRFRMK